MKFYEIAKAALERGLTVCPVHPNEKRGVLWNQYKHPATTRSEITQLDKDFGDYGVGVVGKCELGHVVFWDVDSDGVKEKFERDTGTSLPATHVVQSQPLKKPWKQHWYFRHTHYSVSRLGREINVKDWNAAPDERGIQPTLFDLKGAGRGGYVIAEGSRHLKGETYTGNGIEHYAPIPDALVDWILKEQTHARSEAAKWRERRKREVADTGNPATDKPLTEDYIKGWIKSRVGSLHRLSIRKKNMLRLVTEMIEDAFKDGKRIAKEQQDRIRREIADKNYKMGDPTFAVKQKDADRRPVDVTQSPVTIRHDIIELVVNHLPNEITTSAARKAVEKELKRRKCEIGLPDDKTGRRVLSRALRAAGYRVKGCLGNDRVWVQAWQTVKKDIRDNTHPCISSDADATLDTRYKKVATSETSDQTLTDATSRR